MPLRMKVVKGTYILLMKYHENFTFDIVNTVAAGRFPYNINIRPISLVSELLLTYSTPLDLTLFLDFVLTFFH
uniref:Uncharacterized protein n=1 Tax=Megaselia scalaris TaxID=36166 RepID=T1GXW8_MEGSC